MKNEIIISSSLDPYLNLSIENYLLREEFEGHRLFLWRSSPSIVMGRFQNPWLECKIDKIEEDGVNLVRRQSGGGTVYHDEGNLNFTFLSPRNSYNKITNLDFIIEVLAEYGFNLKRNERNDIILDDKFKVSGSAFKENRDYCFHHGTLLVSSDLSRLNDYLESKEHLETKSVKSVRSVVKNLNESIEIDVSKVISLIKDAFIHNYRGEHINKSFLENEEVQNYYEKLKSSEWVFEETPKFIKILISSLFFIY